MNIIKKNIKVLITIIAVLAVAVGITIYQQFGSSNTIPPKNNIDYTVNITSVVLPTKTNNYQGASQEQTKEIKELYQNYYNEFLYLNVGEFYREVYIIMGDLPQNTPRLTLDEAKYIAQNTPLNEIEKSFNKICGAPDFLGGTGIGRAIYFLNDEHTEYINVSLGEVNHVKRNSKGAETYTKIK